MTRGCFSQDEGWAWVVLVGCFVCIFFMMGTTRSAGMFLTELQSTFDVTTFHASLLLGGYSLGFAVAVPVWITVGQKFGIRLAVVVGSVFAGASIILSSLLLSMNWVIATLGICFGVGSASVLGNCLVLVSVYFNTKRTLANGLAMSGSSVGQFVLPPFLEYLVEHYGLSGCLMIFGAVYLNVVAAAFVFRPASYWTCDDNSASATIVANRFPDEIKHNVQFVENKPAETQETDTNGAENCMLDKCPERKYGGSSELMMDVKDGPARDRLLSPVRLGCNADDVCSKQRSLSEVKCISYLSSTGSFCVRPRSLYASSVLFDPADMMLHWDGQFAAAQSWGQRLNSALRSCTLLRSYMAWFVIVTGILPFLSYYSFMLFLPATAISRGITSYDKAFVMSLGGLGDLIGRVATAIVGDRNLIPRYKLEAAALLVMSLNIFGVVFADTATWLGVHSALFGLCGGVHVVLIAVVITDFVGLDNTPKMLGVSFLTQGIAGFFFQPFLGVVSDISGSFKPVMAICFVLGLAGSAILLCYPLVLKLERMLPRQCRLLPADKMGSSVKLTSSDVVNGNELSNLV